MNNELTTIQIKPTGAVQLIAGRSVFQAKAHWAARPPAPRSRRIRTAFISLVFVVLASSLSCSPRHLPDQKSQIEVQRASILKELATLHNAVTNTETILGSDQRLPFSYEIQQGLADAKSRPLLIDGRIEDICIRKGRVLMEMEVYLGQKSSMFRITLDANTASRIRASDMQRYDPIAVVVRITSIEKAAFEVSSSGEELYMSLGDNFIVNGECIDFRALPK